MGVLSLLRFGLESSVRAEGGIICKETERTANVLAVSRSVEEEASSNWQHPPDRIGVSLWLVVVPGICARGKVVPADLHAQTVKLIHASGPGRLKGNRVIRP